MNKYYLGTIALVIAFIAGFLLSWGLYHQKSVIHDGDTHGKILHDSSVIVQKIHDTVFSTKLQTVMGTKVVHDIQIKIVPDTLIKVDTAKRGDTIYITKTIGHDTIEVRMAILRDNRNGTLSVQAKAINGKLISSIDIPKDSLVFVQYKNALGVWTKFSLLDGTLTAGAQYNRAIGPIFIGGSVGTQVNDFKNNWKNLNGGLQFGVNF